VILAARDYLQRSALYVPSWFRGCSNAAGAKLRSRSNFCVLLFMERRRSAT